MWKHGGLIGVSDHGGWAVLVTVTGDGTLLDRRRIELVDEDLPKIPHHSEGQRLPLDEAVELVERVRASAERHAVLILDAVARAVPHILGVALRQCPELPPTIAERIQDYHAQNNADWVMYRKALAAARRAVGPSTGTTRKTCLMQRARRCTSRTSMHTSSKCGRPSGRLGTRITSSQWQRP